MKYGILSLLEVEMDPCVRKAYLVEMECHVIHFYHNVTWQSRCAEPAEWIFEHKLNTKNLEREEDNENLTMLVLWSWVSLLKPFFL